MVILNYMIIDNVIKYTTAIVLLTTIMLMKALASNPTGYIIGGNINVPSVEKILSKDKYNHFNVMQQDHNKILHGIYYSGTQHGQFNAAEWISNDFTKFGTISYIKSPDGVNWSQPVTIAPSSDDLPKDFTDKAYYYAPVLGVSSNNTLIAIFNRIVPRMSSSCATVPDYSKPILGFCSTWYRKISTDSGQTWSAKEKITVTANFTEPVYFYGEIKTLPLSGDMVTTGYARYTSSGHRLVFLRSKDLGKTWVATDIYRGTEGNLDYPDISESSIGVIDENSWVVVARVDAAPLQKTNKDLSTLDNFRPIQISTTNGGTTWNLLGQAEVNPGTAVAPKIDVVSGQVLFADVPLSEMNLPLKDKTYLLLTFADRGRRTNEVYNKSYEHGLVALHIAPTDQVLTDKGAWSENAINLKTDMFSKYDPVNYWRFGYQSLKINTVFKTMSVLNQIEDTASTTTLFSQNIKLTDIANAYLQLVGRSQNKALNVSGKYLTFGMTYSSYLDIEKKKLTIYLREAISNTRHLANLYFYNIPKQGTSYPITISFKIKPEGNRNYSFSVTDPLVPEMYFQANATNTNGMSSVVRTYVGKQTSATLSKFDCDALSKWCDVSIEVSFKENNSGQLRLSVVLKNITEYNYVGDPNQGISIKDFQIKPSN